jgi:hypothetical protein
MAQRIPAIARAGEPHHQRTLREVAAKRRIVSRYRDAPVTSSCF